MSAGTAATAAAVALTVGCVARHGEAAMQKVEPEPEPEPSAELQLRQLVISMNF